MCRMQHSKYATRVYRLTEIFCVSRRLFKTFLFEFQLDVVCSLGAWECCAHARATAAARTTNAELDAATCLWWDFCKLRFVRRAIQHICRGRNWIQRTRDFEFFRFLTLSRKLKVNSIDTIFASNIDQLIKMAVRRKQQFTNSKNTNRTVRSQALNWTWKI